jgi:hypothetical protein
MIIRFSLKTGCDTRGGRKTSIGQEEGEAAGVVATPPAGARSDG